MEWIPITKNDIVIKDHYTDTYYFTDDFCKRENIDYSTTYNDVWITTDEGEVLMDKVDIDKYGYAFYSNSLEYITAFMWIEEPEPYKS